MNMPMNKDQIRDTFQNQGYVVLQNFLSDDEVESLKSEAARLVDSMDPKEHRAVPFRTGPEKQVVDNYFMESADKIRYFFEDGAIDDEGRLTVDKRISLNKIGHALHSLDPVFKKVTFSDKIKTLVRSLGFVDPAVVQSMYIFKNPRIGGEVIPHQDGTYLYTEPLKLLGLWFPLEDATLENGCLWFVPGSHTRPISRRFVRNNDPEGSRMIYTQDESDDSAPLKDSDFVACPSPKGSCVIIHGQVVHKSEKNLSSRPRPAYTFHVIDQHQTTYSTQNWLQPSENLPFPSMYETTIDD